MFLTCTKYFCQGRGNRPKEVPRLWQRVTERIRGVFSQQKSDTAFYSTLRGRRCSMIFAASQKIRIFFFVLTFLNQVSMKESSRNFQGQRETFTEYLYFDQKPIDPNIKRRWIKLGLMTKFLHQLSRFHFSINFVLDQRFRAKRI